MQFYCYWDRVGSVKKTNIGLYRELQSFNISSGTVDSVAASHSKGLRFKSLSSQSFFQRSNDLGPCTKHDTRWKNIKFAKINIYSHIYGIFPECRRDVVAL